MGAIVIVNQENQYSKLNGQSFKIGDFMSTSVGLVGVNPEYPKNQVGFSFEEIVIQDLEQEIKYAVDFGDPIRLGNLIKYCEKNNYALSIIDKL